MKVSSVYRTEVRHEPRLLLARLRIVRADSTNCVPPTLQRRTSPQWSLQGRTPYNPQDATDPRDSNPRSEGENLEIPFDFQHYYLPELEGKGLIERKIW